MFILFYLMSFLLVISSDDLILMWLGLELNMMSFLYIMYDKCSIISVESVMKYFIIQSISSVFLMLVLYLNKYMDMWSVILSMKMGGAPFFWWLPSLMDELKWYSCYLLMSMQKLIPLVLLGLIKSWVILILSVLSLYIGVVGSMNQIKLKILMGYSSIHHLGWMMLSLMMKGGYEFIYLVGYSFMTYPIVFYLSGYKMFYIVDMVKNYNWLLMILILSMGGIPPFLGFFLKWMVFCEVVNMSLFFCGVMMVASVAMLYIYIRMMYFMICGSKSYCGWYEEKYSFSSFLLVDMMIFVGIMVGVELGMIFYIYLN